jgi:hypothetical protein
VLEFDQISGARKILISAASFSALEPVANVFEKKGKAHAKKHDDLQKTPFELMQRCGCVDGSGYVR